MNRKFKLKIFGWYIYLSPKRMKTYHPQLKACNHVSLARRVKEIRNRRYKTTRGCCEGCGEQHEKTHFEIHHILPLNEFPQLARKDWNLMMLCRRCHYMVHHNPLWSVELMQKVAKPHGIDLCTELRRATSLRWQEKQYLTKGGAL